MPILQVIILAIIQGLAELLPVSSSAHVVVAEKLMHLDPAAPQMTLLLVMLHTGTMFAVIAYFWNRWKLAYFSTAERFKDAAGKIILATFLTAVVGYPIQKIIEKTMFKGQSKAEIEQLFGRLDLIAIALFCAGVLILIAGLERRRAELAAPADDSASITYRQSGIMGAVQGLCLPFRGFSRSGATISTGMLTGVPRATAETFSFALAVVLTPAVILRELYRVLREAHHLSAIGTPMDLKAGLLTSLLGAFFAFLAGLAALKWLSSWLEAGRWWLFGVYCLIASAVVFYLYTQGF